MRTMQTRNMLIVGGAALLLLVAAALWILFQQPRGVAKSLRLLSAANPALDVRYHYDPSTFRPAPYDQHGEFPLRLDAKDWSFYGKRIKGAGELLVKQPQAVVYKFVNDAGNSVYTEFYKLVQEGETKSDAVELGGLPSQRESMVLALVDQSRGWPSYFPAAIVGNQTNPMGRQDKRADKAFGDIPEVEQYKHDHIDNAPEHSPAQTKAFVYSWAQFDKKDLFFFQAVSARPLTDAELQTAEAIIDSMEYDALLGAAGAPAAGEATPPPADTSSLGSTGLNVPSKSPGGTPPAKSSPPPASPSAPPAPPPAAPGS